MTRCPFAVWRPGPDWKVYSWWPTNPKDGIVDHSMAGYRAGAESRLYGVGPANEASWHFSIYQDGTLEQHYEVEAVCWHAGYPANLHYIGVEHEGVPDESLTEPQFAMSVRLHRWLFAEHPRWGKPERRRNLWEHGELMATACPTDRIPWDRLLAALNEEDEMVAQRIFIGVEGRSEVYERTASGLVHITSPELFIDLGGEWETVKKYPFGDPIWDLPVLFPAGLHASLKAN